VLTLLLRLRENCPLDAPFDFTACSGYAQDKRRKNVDNLPYPVRAEPFDSLRTGYARAKSKHECITTTHYAQI